MITEAEYKVVKAVQMAGRALDLTHPAGKDEWANHSKGLLKAWREGAIDWECMLEVEYDIVGYCIEELVAYVNWLSYKK